MKFGQVTKREGNTQERDINKSILLKWILKETMCDNMDGIFVA
jgi:hypothetical protein